ncbi:MAG: uroporphyrinogen-III C-methyltransferase [Zoogloeaceae bacterium]|jgi:uroporphyrin-3 C-methyltransferase|nr:uroporphyrinogen-III C-methyltransferase [Zoogloeaceae bacterium]
MSSKTPLPPLPVLPVSSYRDTRRFWRNPWFWITLFLLGGVAWQWMEIHSTLNGARQEFAQRLAENDRAMQEARTLLDKSMQDMAELQRNYGALDARLGEFQDQATALQNLYQEAATSRDDALLAEVEQNIHIAAQQLQLSSNVQAAILALQAADGRLQRLEPRFLPLRRALASDLETLRATPFVDVAGMSLRLENVIVSIDRLPLALDVVAQEQSGKEKDPEAPEEAENDAGWADKWNAFVADAWQEIRGLVRIQRFDRQEAALLSVEQSSILRENLKLRLLNARLALLMHDQWTFRNELLAAQTWLERYFNLEAKPTQAALSALQQLAATEITIALPNLHGSLNAMQHLKTGREKR